MHRFLARLFGRPAGYFRRLFGPGLTPLQRALHALRGCWRGGAGHGRVLLLAWALAADPLHATGRPGAEGAQRAAPACCWPPMAPYSPPSGAPTANGCRWTASPRMWWDALVATEDHRFWQHPGVDWRRSLAAMVYTLGGDRQGGSTLEQQLARNFFPREIGRAPTASRKLKEITSPPSSWTGPTPSATSWRPTSTPSHSTTTRSASRWPRAPTSTSRPSG